MKTTFHGEQNGWFSLRTKNQDLSKNINENFIVQKTVELWILSSVATLEVHKSENGVKTNCYKFKKNTIEVKLEWFPTTRTAAAATPRIIIFTPPCPKIRAFFRIDPNVCIQFPQKWKKISTNSFHHCKLNPMKILTLEYDKKIVEKMLQTKCEVKKLVNWVQLKIYSG